jgi:2-oxoglutarate ferredoxin oxidoreductase subunit delta
MASAESNKKKPRRKFRGEVFLNTEQCKGCGFCIEFCPTHVLAMGDELNAKGYHTPTIVNLEACTGCDLCGLYCPDFTIHGIRVPVEGGNKKENADAG